MIFLSSIVLLGLPSNVFAAHFVSTVAQGNLFISSPSTDYYEGEKRVVPIGSTLFAFYYNATASDTFYKTSTNGGMNWGTSSSAGTGPISSDAFRFGLQTDKTHDAVQHIVLLYYTSSGSNSTFFAKRGNVTGTNIIWNSPTTIFTVANPPDCQINYGGGACAAAVSSTDPQGNIFAAFRWATTSSYHYTIYRSSDGGLTWKISLKDFNTGETSRNAMTLTSLGKGQMLFVNAPYRGLELQYRVFNGAKWSPVSTTSGAELLPVGEKQISSASNSTHFAFVTFVRGGNSGPLRMATWNNSTGAFERFETANSKLSHSQPSIVITSSGVIHIFTLSGGKVYDTIKSAGVWSIPTNPFGTSFVSPDQLTCSVTKPLAMWMEGTFPNFSLKFG